MCEFKQLLVFKTPHQIKNVCKKRDHEYVAIYKLSSEIGTKNDKPNNKFSRMESENVQHHLRYRLH